MTMTEQTQRPSSYRSRDYSNATGVDTLQRPDQRVRPRREYHRVAEPPVRKKRRFQHQPGSQQIISFRGRRIIQDKVDPKTIYFVISLTIFLVAGLAATMYVTGQTTQQSFRIQSLKAQDQVLSNQLETLHRDLSDVSSTGNIAQKAADMGMVIPNQTGILSTDPEGNVVEQRPAGNETQPITNINQVVPNAKDDQAAAQQEQTPAVAPTGHTNQAGQEQSASPVANTQPATPALTQHMQIPYEPPAVPSDTNIDNQADALPAE